MKAHYDDLDEYITDLRAEISRGGNCAIHQYNLGVAMLTKRDFVAAEAAFLDALRTSPHLAEAYVQLGGICLQRGDLDGCLRYNEEAAQCRAKFPAPWANIGFVHMQRGEPEKAVAALKKALKWDPRFIQAMASLASAYIMLGDYESSIAVSEEAIRLEPNFGPALNNLALAWLEKGDGKKALAYAERAQASGYEVAPEFLQELEIWR